MGAGVGLSVLSQHSWNVLPSSIGQHLPSCFVKPYPPFCPFGRAHRAWLMQCASVVGTPVGKKLGLPVGAIVGLPLGAGVGLSLGLSLGAMLGESLGAGLGLDDGAWLGARLGVLVLSQHDMNVSPSGIGQHRPVTKPSASQRGWPPQLRSTVGLSVGNHVGLTVGLRVGLTLGLADGMGMPVTYASRSSITLIPSR